MKLKLLDGTDFSPCLKSKVRAKSSGLHKKAVALVKELYPCMTLVEELNVPEGKNGIYFDLYLPQISLVIEVQGEQHFKNNSFFHKNMLEFQKAKRRDELKREWCACNELHLVELNYNESIDEWRDKIKNRFGDGKV